MYSNTHINVSVLCAQYKPIYNEHNLAMHDANELMRFQFATQLRMDLDQNLFGLRVDVQEHFFDHCIVFDLVHLGKQLLILSVDKINLALLAGNLVLSLLLIEVIDDCGEA